MLRRKRLADLPEHWDFGELTPGAQVRVRRSGYYHHGIYIGNGEIVHFDGSPNEQDAAAVRVRRTGMEEFLRGGLPELRIYGRAERKLLRAPRFLPSAAAAMTTGRTTVSTFPTNALLASTTAARAGRETNEKVVDCFDSRSGDRRCGGRQRSDFDEKGLYSREGLC